LSLCLGLKANSYANIIFQNLLRIEQQKATPTTGPNIKPTERRTKTQPTFAGSMRKASNNLFWGTNARRFAAKAGEEAAKMPRRMGQLNCLGG
jgi:hypothetical protein